MTWNYDMSVAVDAFNEQDRNLLESPYNNNTSNHQGSIGNDDLFSQEIERVIQYFNSIILLLLLESALRKYEIDGWILL